MQFAHLLFVESPAFTGFSTSDDPAADRSCDDAKITRDHVAFLRGFMLRHPSLAGE